MTPGQIVFPIKGRGKGSAMIVLATDGEYAYLVDGKNRLLEKPKKKKGKKGKKGTGNSTRSNNAWRQYVGISNAPLPP